MTKQHKLSSRPTAKPHLPTPFREGNKIMDQWQEPFIDPVGNKGIYTKVDYLVNVGTKKEKMIKNYILRVKWL